MRLICLVGPTGSGKTELSVEVAKKIDGEIVNADSRQFYQELEIGTAKPSKQYLSQVPHHFINCASLKNPWSVSTFVKSAEEVIAGIFSRHRVPIVVGGTGLYVRSLLFGLDEIPVCDSGIRAKLKSDLNEIGLEGLYQELRKVDSESANSISPKDTQRILRALEVYQQTGRTIRSFWKQDKKARYDYVKIGIQMDRSVLYERINQRVDDMMVQGLFQEVKQLNGSYPDNEVLLKTIGYSEWLKHGFDDRDLVVDLIKKNSRHFAKRQLTWFRNEKDIQWCLSNDVIEKLMCV